MLTRLNGYLTMTKPRAMAAVLVTAAAGQLLATRGGIDAMGLVHLLVGAALAGGGSIVLNQFLERDHDARMHRTRGRSLPSGRVAPSAAFVYGIVLSVVGTAWLTIFCNPLTGWLGGLCVVSYVLGYTPLKRVSSLNAVVGAIPGAIPPMMGWTAVTGELGAEAWALFLILFVWQFPHFLALGWLHRHDYARAGYAMLSARDADGSVTARQMVLNAACLMVVSLVPVRLVMAGWIYALAAAILGAALLAVCFVFLRRRSDAAATLVLRGTIAHITLLMTFLVLDRSA